MNTATNTRI